MGLITYAFRHGVQNFGVSTGTQETTRIYEGSTYIEQTYIEEQMEQMQPSTFEVARYHNLMKEADE